VQIYLRNDTKVLEVIISHSFYATIIQTQLLRI